MAERQAEPLSFPLALSESASVQSRARVKESHMEKRRIGIASLALAFLACAGNAGSEDAGSSATDVSNGPYVILPDARGMEAPKMDVPHCNCETWLSPCPGDAAACVGCQDSPPYCSECPVPFSEPRTCTTVGLHCVYAGQTWCDCTAVEGEAPAWVCVACPC